MWKTVYRKLWILVTIPIVAGLVSYFLTWDSARKYRSSAFLSADFVVDKRAETDPSGLPGTDMDYENLVGLMKTELISSMVSYRLMIHDLEEAVPFRSGTTSLSPTEVTSMKRELKEKLASFALLSVSDPMDRDLLVALNERDYDVGEWIRDGELIIERKGGTNWVSVEFLSDDPFLSAFVVNTLCSEYIRYENSLVGTTNRDTIETLSEQVARKKKTLDEKAAQLSTIRQVKLVPGENEEVNKARIQDHENQQREEKRKRDRVKGQLGEINTRIAALSNKPTKARTDVLSDAKIVEIKNKIDQLNKIFVGGGSKDKRLETTINELKKRLNDETARLNAQSADGSNQRELNDLVADRERLESALESHETNIGSLEASIRRLKARKPTPHIDSRLSRFKQEYEASLMAYDSAVSRLRQAEKVENTQRASSAELKLAIKGQPSAEPDSARALMIIILAVAGCWAVCFILIVIKGNPRPPEREFFLHVVK